MRFAAASLFALTFAAASPAQEKKEPVIPLKAGMVFAGTFKSGTPNKQGVLVKPFVHDFELQIESMEGNTFVGRWTWEKGKITELKGSVTEAGLIGFRFTRNIKGESVVAFDGRASGGVTAEKLTMKYARPSGGRIGLIEARVKEPK